MTFGKKSVFSVLILLLTWGTISSADVVYDYFHQPKNKHEVSLFFVQHARQADFTPAGKECYQITLKKIGHEMLYFSDRPERIVGHISNQRFADLWQGRKLQPNVVLHGNRHKNIANNSYQIVLTLGQPNFTYDTDMIRYKGCITDRKDEKPIKVKTLYNVVLFIDPWDPWAGG